MDKEVKRELTVVVANMLLLKITAKALEQGEISLAQFTVIAQAMDLLLQTYEAAHPLTDAPVIPDGNGSVN